jgi:hypothetical protein
MDMPAASFEKPEISVVVFVPLLPNEVSGVRSELYRATSNRLFPFSYQLVMSAVPATTTLPSGWTLTPLAWLLAYPNDVVVAVTLVSRVRPSSAST